MIRVRLVVFWLIFALALIPAIGVTAGGEGFTEDEIKAAFVLNFFKFVRWPAGDRDEPRVVTVVGPSGVTPALEFLAEQSTKRGAPVVVNVIDDIAHISYCHILFVPDEQRDQLSEILNEVGTRSILTVGESDGAAERGVAVNLVRINDKLALEINKDAVDRGGLRISPQLLKVSRIVVGPDSRRPREGS